MIIPEDFQSERLMFIARAIATRGLAVMSVGSGECSVPGCRCEPEAVPWSYTIGLVERRHPEIVTLGLPPTAAVAVLNWVNDRDVSGSRIVPGAIERFGGVPIQLVPVPREWVMSEEEPMGQWFAHYGIGRATLEPPSVLQLLWGDRRGHLPGEMACEPRIDELQPRLLEHPDWVPGQRVRARRNKR
jgi:Domain of unknown function (DUF4262)